MDLIASSQSAWMAANCWSNQSHAGYRFFQNQRGYHHYQPPTPPPQADAVFPAQFNYQQHNCA